MKDIEQALQAGRDLETPADLAAKVKGAVDAELAAGAAAAGGATVKASLASTTTWVAGVAIAIVLGGLLTYPFWSGETDPSASPSSIAWTPDEPGAGHTAGAPVEAETAVVPESTGFADTETVAGTADGEPEEAVGAESGAIHGVVTDPWGNPLPGARVIVRGRSAQQQVVSGGDGAYHVSLASLQEIAELQAQRRVEEQIWNDLHADPAVATSSAANGSKVKESKVKEKRREAARRRSVEMMAQVETADPKPVVDVSYEEVLQRLASRRRGNEVTSYFEFPQLERDLAAQARVVVQRDAQNEQAMRLREVEFKQLQELREEAAKRSGQLRVSGVDGTWQVLPDTFAATDAPRYSRFEVTVTAPGFRASRPEVLLLEMHERVRVEFRLEEAEGLRGVVLDGTGEPIAGATIAIVGGFERVLPEEEQRTSAEDGTFEFQALPPGLQVVRVSAAELESVERVVATGDETVVFQLEAAAVLEVVVTRATGEAIRHARVELLRDGKVFEQAHADRQGSVLFDDLAPGRTILRVYDPRGAFPGYEDELSLRGGEERQREVQLPERVEILGQLRLPAVEDEASKSEGGYLVLAFRGEYPGSQSPRAWAAEDGSFSFEGGLHPGSYTMGVATLRDGKWGLRMLENMRIREGESQVVNVDFVETTPATLEVRVRNATGDALKASVSMARERTGSRATRQSNDEGVYRVDLHPDRFLISVRAKGYETQSFADVRLESEDVRVLEVVLEPKADPIALDLFRSEGEIQVRSSIRARSMLELVDELEPNRVAISAELEDSLLLERKVGETGSVPEVVASLIEALGLTWHVDAGQLVLGLPAR